jgi:hypothetical protein
MNAIILAALIYRLADLPKPKVGLAAVYRDAGFEPQDCFVTDWNWTTGKPQEAECSRGNSWAHFALNPEAL